MRSVGATLAIALYSAAEGDHKGLPYLQRTRSGTIYETMCSLRRMIGVRRFRPGVRIEPVHVVGPLPTHDGALDRGQQADR